MNENEDEEISKELELIAYGCHRRVFFKLSEFLNQRDIQSFTFYEYFCREKIKNSDGRDNLNFLCPFVKRYAMGLPLLPMEAKLSNKQTLKIISKERDRRTLICFYKPLIITLEKESDSFKVVENWKAKKGEIREKKAHIFWWENKGVEAFREYLQKAEASLPQRREFAIVNKVWFEYLTENEKRENKNVTFLYVPIASPTFFYGELLLITKQIEQKKLEEIGDFLWNISREEYLPLLILFNNYWEEKKLKKSLEKGSNIDIINPFQSSDESTDELEKRFSDIWEWRDKNKENIEQLSDSLIMPKYFVASPGMIQQVSKAITLNPKNSSVEIPCILVVGGPGTGKEKMAKLISWYSDDFRDAEHKTINMAALKPNEVSAPILMGVKLCGKSFDGLIKQSIIGSKRSNSSIVLIFDELNSLPIEIQGALLRLIENRELTPVGSIEKEKRLRDKKILIIGLMNEDPEKLTKIYSLQNILHDKQLFGGLFGEVAYEYVRKLRRLRNDLYDRMKRYGIIHIPELKNRREDIPSLFYNFLKQEVGEEKNLIIEYESFELLMDKSIEWPGNIRQLQALCKSVSNILKNKGEIKNKNKDIVVNRFVIKQALNQSGLLLEKNGI
jgi:DNA-binding NtrC family response regulator